MKLLCYVVKSLSKIRVAHSTCTRGLYMTPTTPTRVRGRHFGQTITTRPHKPISEAWKAVREQKTVKKWVVFLAISEIFGDFFTTETFQSHLVVSIAYQNVRHGILSNLRHFPTKCEAIRRHRNTNTLFKKNPLRLHLYELVTILLHFVNLDAF